MQVLYKSTRGKEEAVTASMAILKGLSEDGGLFVPTEIPKLDVPMDKLAQMSYQETAYEVMKRFLTDFTEEELKNCISRAYDDKFDTKTIAPLHEADGVYFLELYHGATIAFKDMALSILPHLMTTAAKKNNVKNEIVILTATSGDTGKAAMAGFADVPGTKIIVFYPKNGVSPIQEKQMVTQKGNNTYVVGITGNFDDAQTAVKKIQVSVPAGIDNGQSIRIREKGEPGTNGGPRGDLLVEVNVARHPIFQRQDMNIFSTAPLTYAQAALGGTVRINTVDGEVEYEVKPGTQTDTRIRLKGKGVPSLRNKNVRGDHYVTLVVQVPTNLNEEAKEALRKFDEACGNRPKENADGSEKKKKSFMDKLKETFED